MSASVLIVDDDMAHLGMLRTLLRDWGYEIHEADDGGTAVEMVRERAFDVILMDVRMARMSGIEALAEIKAYNPSIPVLIMTAYTSVESAVEALKSGAYDYLTKPLDFDVLRITLERALDHTRLREENKVLKGGKPEGSPIIGKSRAVEELMDMIAAVAPTEATALVIGESGTGKELFARAIHQGSARAGKPLVTVNCAALTETLLESELFGHEKGAFTGASARREGRFMQADKGAMFLDEIGEISPAMQAKLLRVLQEGEVQRVGSDKPLHVDVRIIAATNRDLGAEVEAGRFREDLYYRLNVITLNVPPLREREGDVPLLVNHFLKVYAEKNRKVVKGVSPTAMDLLLKHPWPGNVRELENAVERAVILTTGEYVTERELPMNIQKARDECPPQGASLSGRSLEDIEREAVVAALKDSGGNKSRAAKTLGITRATLHNKLKKYALDEG